MTRVPTTPQALEALHRWRPGPATRIVVIAVFLGTAIIRIGGMPFTHSFGEFDRIDIDVYRIGGQMLRDGAPLYASGSMPFTSDGLWLPFTYPPFAAFVFLPLSLLSLTGAAVTIAVITTVLTCACMSIFLRRLHIGSPHNHGALVLITAIAALWTNPYWMTLGFGQINVVLMALVAVDLLVLDADSRLRGIPIAIAAAIKLTPLAFIVYFAVRRQWSALTRSVIAFLAIAGLSASFAPHDSRVYWTYTLFHTDRIGDLSGGINQSVNGFLVRVLDVSESTEHAIWAVTVVMLTVLAFAAVTNANKLLPMHSGGDVLAVALVAIWAVLVSPTSWAHHWVWGVVAVMALAVAAVHATASLARRTLWASSIVGALILLAGPFQFLPKPATQWSVWQAVAGNAYCLWAILVLVAVAGLSRHSAPSPQAAGSERVDV